MAEYIEREPMIEEMQRLIDNVSRNFPKATETELIILKGKYEAFMEYIKEQPAADVQPVDRWISAEDRLPEDNGDCLVWYSCDTAFGKSESWGIAHCSRCDWYTKHLDGDNIVVLYWQSMPEPPETTKG